MKSLKYLIILLSLLLIVALTLVLTNHKSTIPATFQKVAVPNTGEISLITITSGADQIILARDNGDWRLNNAFKAKKEAIDLLLNMLQRLEVAAPVPRRYQAIAAKKLVNQGKFVQIHTGNHLLRSFYIAYDTSETLRTIYLKEGSKTPFILKLKGYSLSDISLLFSLQVRFWRDDVLFNYKPSDISAIQVDYPLNPSQSFKISIRSENRSELVKTSTGESIKNVDNEDTRHYLYYFSGVEYQLSDTDILPVTDDDLLFAEISITDVSDTTVQVRLYRKALKTSSDDAQKYDLYRCFGRINEENEIISVKYVDIDPILRELDDFLKK
jgi:hypothetical protein